MNFIIIGSGYVGLPLAIALSKKNKVISYDIDHERIKNLQKGIDLNKQHKKNEILNKNLTFTSRKELIKNKDVYIVTVPTPINKKKLPDLSMMRKSCALIGKSIKKKSIIIFESTTYPGCTEEICVPLIEKNSNLTYNSDFYVGYSPERVNPGDKVNTLNKITKIVSSNNPITLKIIIKIYKSICKTVYPVNNISVAESAKVIENTQRDINIAFINELSILFDKMGIPTNEVLKAAASKWNFHYYRPGLVGGHCISVDPYYLAYKAKKKNYLPKLVLSGRKTNESMSKFIAKKIINLIGKKKKRTKIAILGFAFKENIPDVRNTKVFDLYKELRKYFFSIKIYDDLASKNIVKKKYKLNLKSFKEFKQSKFDVIILAVSHKIFLKKLNFYNKFFNQRKNKIFIDIKNNYKISDFKINNYNFFQL
jgi:UDP-N-acetyl-D-galactosamine dehydrogenase